MRRGVSKVQYVTTFVDPVLSLYYVHQLLWVAADSLHVVGSSILSPPKVVRKQNRVTMYLHATVPHSEVQIPCRQQTLSLHRAAISIGIGMEFFSRGSDTRRVSGS
jgi:hypothetical protein